jgi:hypothetical protein
MRHSNDEDFILPKPSQRAPPGDAPIPPPLPKFEPLKIPKTTPQHNLLTTVDRNDPVAIFDLFFTEDVIQSLTDCTNANIRYRKSQEVMDPRLTPHIRTGKDIAPIEMYGFLGISLWMGCHPKF